MCSYRVADGAAVQHQSILIETNKNNKIQINYNQIYVIICLLLLFSMKVTCLDYYLFCFYFLFFAIHRLQSHIN